MSEASRQPSSSRQSVARTCHWRTPCSFSEADPCVLILRVAYGAWQFLAKRLVIEFSHNFVSKDKVDPSSRPPAA